MAQAAACGPDSNPSPLAELRVGPSPRGLSPSGVASSPAPYGTAANDASMMMQPLPQGNAGVTGADGERHGQV